MGFGRVREVIAAPKEIERVGSTHIKVTWPDGHESLFPNNLLRSECPCATCNDFRRKREAKRGLNVLPQGTPTSVYAQSMSLVGSYAVQIRWSDGHQTGIYIWDFLREICPCEECKKQRA